MAKYTVKKGVIVLDGKGYYKDEVIELSAQQYEKLKEYVNSEEAEKVESGEVALDTLKVEELRQLALDKNVEVTGTGKDGSVKKEDLINALS